MRRANGKPANGLPAWSATGAPATKKAPASAGTEGKGAGNGGGNKKDGDVDQPGWKKWLKRILLGLLIAMLGLGLIAVLALWIRYENLEIPEPDDFAQAQSSIFYYADGETEMGRLGVADREIVAYEDLPEYVGNAIVAAEDRSFWTNPGINIPGMAKALWDTIVLDNPRGGSSITQQYVERYYVGETTTSIKGKIDETLMALKIDQEQEKSDVLENYMNTIYLGRGAYGIEAAAQQYYGKHASELTVSESAMIAGLIPAPSAWDPRINHDKAEQRWNYVLDGMVDAGFLSADERADITEFPETIEYVNEDVYAGTEGYILRAALEEVAASTGITQEEIESMGYRITTTIVPEHQKAAEEAVAQMPEDHADNLRTAAVTVEAATGAITSMYGGEDYLEIQRNAVTQDVAQAGSTFKPFALIAALERGIGLESEYLGNNKMEFEGFENPVRNFGGVSYGYVDLIEATQKSINTAYVGLNEDVTPQVTMETAIAAGLPEDTLGLEANLSNVLGTASPHPLDMANAYATIASGGLRTEAHLIASVSDWQGEQVYVYEEEPERVFAEDVMADTTYAMQQVVKYGSGSYAGENIDRPLAGKTGTSNDNRSAWFVGFSPQIVGAVALYQVGEDGSAEQITPFGGFSQITGSTVPVRVWTWMMQPIFESMDIVDFPERANVGTNHSAAPTELTTSPSPTATEPEPEETTEEPVEPEPEPTTEEPDPEPSTPPVSTPDPEPSVTTPALP